MNKQGFDTFEALRPIYVTRLQIEACVRFKRQGGPAIYRAARNAVLRAHMLTITRAKIHFGYREAHLRTTKGSWARNYLSRLPRFLIA
jgi:hypothetical protein